MKKRAIPQFELGYQDEPFRLVGQVLPAAPEPEKKRIDTRTEELFVPTTTQQPTTK